MPRRRIDPAEAKLKRQQRNQRYRANITRREQEKMQDRLYKQEKREQARPRQYQIPLTQLADIATRQQYLEAENDMIDEVSIIGPVEEEETGDVSDMMEEDGEVLENFGDGQGDGGFPDEVDSEMNDNGDGHWEGDFSEEVDSEMNYNDYGQSEGGFPDEVNSDMNDDGDVQSEEEFIDEVDLNMNDDGSQSVINH
jgi:hypothetical protein